MVDEEFSKRIKHAIALSGKSQRKIAEEIGITPQGLSKAAKNGVMARDTLEKFSISTGVSFEELGTGRQPLLHSHRTQGLLDRIAELVAAGRISEEALQDAVDKLDAGTEIDTDPFMQEMLKLGLQERTVVLGFIGGYRKLIEDAAAKLTNGNGWTRNGQKTARQIMLELGNNPPPKPR